MPTHGRSGRRPARRLVEHAVSLIGRQQYGTDAEAQAARDELARWRDADPSHNAAFAIAEQYWAATDASVLRGDVPLPARKTAQDVAREQKRRRLLTFLGVGGLTGVLAGGGRWAWLQPVVQMALHTGHDQLLERDLPDGSHVALAARTAGHLTYYRNRRELSLAAGEVCLDVQHDPSRPFVVDTRWGRVQVLGTRFSVSVTEARMSVAVARGRVAVWSNYRDGVRVDTSAASPDTVLDAGQRAETTLRGVGTPAAVGPDSVGAWRNGWLVFYGTPLPEAISRWNDYIPQAMRLADDPALRGMRLSGTFPVHDPQAFLQNLPGMLPVRVVRGTSGIVISARQ